MSKVIAFGLAVVFSFFLFALMNFLVEGAANAKPVESKPIEITCVNLDDLKPEVIVRKTPPPPPKFKQLVKPPKLAETPPQAPKPPQIMIAKNLGLATDKSMYKTFGSKNFMSNTSSVGLGGEGLSPKVRIQPSYPLIAASKEIEGYVTLKFDINQLGETVNIRVIDAKPKGYFEKASRKALRKWKYRVEQKDGESAVAIDQVVTLNFQLEKS